MTKNRPLKLNYFCRRLGCRMNREACLARQSLAIARWRSPISERLELVSSGFYRECRDCPMGRSLARQAGVSLRSLRRRSSSLRSSIQESDWAISYEIHPHLF